MPQLIRKWRPALWMVLGGALAGTLALSLAGLVALRYLGPEMGFREAAVLLALVIGGLTAILGALLVRLLLRPITSLAAYAGQVRSGTAVLPEPPVHYGTVELGAMGQSVLDMAATLRSREATVRSFTDHVTHELKTPVSAIRAASELLEDSMPDGAPDRQLVAQILGAADQMQLQLEALRRVAAAREPVYVGRSDLAQVARAVAGRHPGLELSQLEDPIMVPLAEDGVQVLLEHLLANAVQHGATDISITTSTDADAIEVRVADNGHGVSDGNAGLIFDPFFTTRREDGGTGMGLAIVASILAAHAGAVSLVSSNNGAAFLLRFRHPD